MWFVALFALVLAVLPTPLAMFSSVVLSGISVLIAVVASAGRLTKVRAATWIFAAYPWLTLASLNLTWLAARWTLGHPPRPLIDDPKFIGDPVSLLRDLTWMLLFGTVPDAMACLLLIFHECVLAIERDEPSRPNEVTRLVFIPLLLWSGAIAVFAFDPGRIFDWLAD